MGWRILYIEESDNLSLYLDNIKIRTNFDEITLPLKDIHTLIIDNYKTNLSVQLINACAEENINLLLCGIDHLPKSYMIPYNGHHIQAFVLKKQITWTESIKGFIQKEIVKSKIHNQISLLKHHQKNQDTINRIQEFHDEVEEKDLTNREGLSAKMYFRELFGNEFKRFSEDVVNYGLNYGYSIIRSQITKTLIAKGLNTSLGIFHRGSENVFNLSDDFIEPFRPLIDDWVYGNLREEKLFKKEHRIELVKLTKSFAYINNQKQTLFNVMVLFVDSILSFIDTGNVEKINMPILIFHDAV